LLKEDNWLCVGGENWARVFFVLEECGNKYFFLTPTLELATVFSPQEIFCGIDNGKLKNRNIGKLGNFC
jgi:hypothetical protein